MSIPVRRISIDNNPILPPEIIPDNVNTPFVIHCIKTLQSWLSNLSDFNDPVDGVWSDNVTNAINSVLPNSSNSSVLISQNTWETLEQKMMEISPIAKIEEPRKNFSVNGKLRDQWQSLREIGIQASGSDEKEIEAGMILYQALVREVDFFSEAGFDDYNQRDLIYPELTNANPQFSDEIWKNFKNHWGIFYGAPWLGVILEVPTPLTIKNSTWCSARLFRLIHKWAAKYVTLVADKKGSINEALEYPIVIRYTGNRLGGKIADRNDFSQIGINAAIDITNQNDERLGIMLDALHEADSAMRLRINKTVAFEKPNLVKSPDMWSSSVLEFDPVQDKLMKRPRLIAPYLRTSPDYFDKYSLDRFAEGMATRVNHLQAKDLDIVFDEIKGLDIRVLVEFLGMLRAQRALGPILKRIDFEDQNLLEIIFGLKLETIDAIAGTSIAEDVLNFQRYIVSAYEISNLVRDFSFFSATLKAKDLVTEFMDEHIPKDR